MPPRLRESTPPRSLTTSGGGGGESLAPGARGHPDAGYGFRCFFSALAAENFAALLARI
jgi:hypothetical protein